MKILIVDDEPGILNAIRVTLLSQGHEAIAAEDGIKALGIIESESRISEAVPVLVVDFRMPGLSGLDLISSARSINPCIPAVLMTAYGDPDLRKRVLALGGCGYLEKPFSPEKLLGVIEKTMMSDEQRVMSAECGMMRGPCRYRYRGRNRYRVIPNAELGTRSSRRSVP